MLFYLLAMQVSIKGPSIFDESFTLLPDVLSLIGTIHLSPHVHGYLVSNPSLMITEF